VNLSLLAPLVTVNPTKATLLSERILKFLVILAYCYLLHIVDKEDYGKSDVDLIVLPWDNWGRWDIERAHQDKVHTTPHNIPDRLRGSQMLIP